MLYHTWDARGARLSVLVALGPHNVTPPSSTNATILVEANGIPTLEFKSDEDGVRLSMLTCPRISRTSSRSASCYVGALEPEIALAA